MRTLVTGAEGFVGRHLVPHLERCGHAVLATSRNGAVGTGLDIADAGAGRAIIGDFRPDAVVHLAAISAVGAANADPQTAYRTNVEGTRFLLEAAQSTGRPCHFVLVSTSAVYGQVPAERLPIKESEAPAPADVYGWTKLAAEALLHALVPGGRGLVTWTILRPFNHTGPGQQPDFALSNFARQIACIERGTHAPVLEVGNLAVRRDFLDVRDVIVAYERVLSVGRRGSIYNVCSGNAYLLSQLLAILCEAARVPIEVTVDPARVRSKDLEFLAGDPSAFARDTGWTPRIPIAQTLRDLLAGWREALDGGAAP